MDALVLKNGTMSSVGIAELTGKQHKHVMESIRIMEPAWEKIAQRKFPLGSYKDANNQDRPCYELNKTNAYMSLQSLTTSLAQNWFSAGDPSRCIQTRYWMRFSQTRIRERADLWIP